ncbi:MAG: glutamate-5-semialdehyde dehydrogenase [Alphaproteobacteria bacterium]
MSVAETLDTPDTLAARMAALGQAARDASHILALATAATKAQAIRAAATAIRAQSGKIQDANARDVAAAERRGTKAAFIDRLRLDESRIEAMAQGLDAIAELPDPVGEVTKAWTAANGLHIERIRVPIGVIGIIYESRPNVTADAGALCLKAGNAAILRGGSESTLSSAAILACLQTGLAEAGLPAACLQRLPTTDRAAVGIMLTMAEFIDVIVPRGGKSLIARVQQESRIPVFAHLEGLCHTYIDGAADLAMARAIALNAKMRRVGICGATETLLVDRGVASGDLSAIIGDLIDAGCEVRGDDTAQAADTRVVPATGADWDTEYLDPIIAVKIVDGVDGAIAHIARHGSSHTDAIVTADQTAADRFLQRVDSAIVLHNASTQYADGGEFGMGAEIGIATGRIHARGPVGAAELTTYKYVVRGHGEIRP